MKKTALLLSAVLFFSSPVLAASKNTQKTDPVMPASFGASLQAADVSPGSPLKGQKLTKEKDGKWYYSDGRLAQERNKNNLTVYTYQDAEGAMTVYRRDLANREFAVERHVNGILTSSLDSDGTYRVFFADKTIEQRIDPETLDVHIYEYSYGAGQECNAEGDCYQVRVLVDKSDYLSTADGKTLVSTTTYVRSGGSVMETTVWANSNRQEIVQDGLLVQSTDADGHVTNYMYKKNKKGELTHRVGTRDDGQVTTVKMSSLKEPKKRGHGFYRVLQAALKSVRFPGQPVSVTLNNGNVYTLESGVLVRVENKVHRTTYHFTDGVLASISKDGATVVRKQGSDYIRL